MKRPINQCYFKQIRGYEIGNFICNTPAIKSLSDYFFQPINVFFQNDFVRDMYCKSPFINIIENERDKECIYNCTAGDETISDYEYIYLEVNKKLLGIDANISDMPFPYVDSYPKLPKIPFSEYIVVNRGGLGKATLKDPGPDIYLKMLETINLPVIFITTSKDFERYVKPLLPAAKKYLVFLDDIKKSLAIINHAKYFISNDSGMYHAAGALDKDMFILWKDTSLIKNKVPSKKAFFSFETNWWSDFNDWKKERNL